MNSLLSEPCTLIVMFNARAKKVLYILTQSCAGLFRACFCITCPKAFTELLTISCFTRKALCQICLPQHLFNLRLLQKKCKASPEKNWHVLSVFAQYALLMAVSPNLFIYLYIYYQTSLLEPPTLV